jgi:hypothetical protein
MVVGSDGYIYQTSYNATNDTTTLRAFHPDGTTTDYTQPGQPVGGSGLFTVTSDGTVYQTTGTGTSPHMDGQTTLVRTYHPDGTFTDRTQPGQVAGGVVIGPDGTSYQTSYKSNSVVVSVVQPDGTSATYELPGSPRSGIVVIASDGTAYQTTGSGLWNLSALTSETSI